MPFRALDPFRREYPELAPYVSLVEQDLEQGADSLEPALLARKLDVDEGLALSVLMAFDKAGLLSPRYDVYCPGDQFLGSYSSLKAIPKLIYCPFDDRKHKRDECAIQLVFVPGETGSSGAGATFVTRG